MHDDNPLNSLQRMVRAALALWRFPQDSEVSLLNVSENSTWLLRESGGRTSVLRLYRPGYNSEDEIASELHWINSLHREGTVSTPPPMPARDGKLIQTLVDGEQSRHAVLFPYVSGSAPSINRDLPIWFERLGEVSAFLQKHARAWQRPAGFTRKVWNFKTTLGDRPHWGSWRDGVGLDAVGRRLLERAVTEIRQRLEIFGAGPERFGLLHADLRLANLLVEGDTLHVIDFDDCGFGWFLYDFAAAISFFEHDPVVPELCEAWIRGYRKLTPLPEVEAQEIPVFVLLRRILLVAWIASHWETTTAKEMGAPYTEGTLALAESFLKTNFCWRV